MPISEGKETKDIREIRDILLRADAVSCSVESYIPELGIGEIVLYNIPNGHRVQIDFNKLAGALYKAGYRKVEEQ